MDWLLFDKDLNHERVKHYTVNLFVEDLRQVDFSNHERFSNIDAAYTDFVNRLMKVSEFAPSKEPRIKNNTQDWFDREVVDLIHAQEKLPLKFKKSKLYIDEEIYNLKTISKPYKKRSEISMKLTLRKN